jgi:hypothetical protein
MITYQMALDAALAAAAHVGARNTSAINRYFRDQDKSQLEPFSGRINAANCAIRRMSREFIECGKKREGLEYAQAIDATLDRITADWS